MASPGKLAELRRPMSRDIEQVAPESSHLTTATLIVRNAVLNLVSEGWVFIVLLVAMPKLVRFLGETQFGLFSLAWVMIGYLTVLDIGVSRAATKFVSEHLADGNLASTRQVVRTAILANLALGLAGGAAVALISPVLVRYVFRVGPGLEYRANLVFYAAAAAIPVLLLQGIFRGVLSSYQRFGWITGVNTVATTLQWGLACVLAWRGCDVAFVVSSTVLVRMLAAIGYGIVLWTILPKLNVFHLPDLAGLSKLVRFGSWVTVSQLVGPLLVYLDRVFIASFVSLGAVALYTVPYEAMTRLRVIPSSLVASLYPAFSERGSQERQSQLNHLYERSICYLLVLLLPTIMLLTVLGSDVLSIWMGRTFARQAVAIIELLALGVLANGMSYIPYNALQAAGRPDLTGKFHLLELPPYVALCLILIPRWGITGAALASTFRFALDAGLLFWAAQKYCRCSVQPTWYSSLRTILTLSCSLAAALLLLRSTAATPWVRVATGILSVFVYLATAWFFVVREEERPRLVSVVKKLCSATS